MKLPIEPPKPLEPEAPKKTNIICQKLYNGADVTTLEELISRVPKGVKLENVYVSSCVKTGMTDYPCLSVYTDVEVENQGYNCELLLYKRALNKYKQQMKNYYKAHAKYVKEKELYNNAEKNREILTLEKRLRKLKNGD